MSIKKIMFSFVLISLLGSSTAFASTPSLSGPIVKNITATTAEVSLPGDILGTLSDFDRQGMYFEYTEPEKMCIMIYPTPPECLPKTTPKGTNPVVLSGLMPNTLYSVTYKKDSTIACITAPCPGNDVTSTPTTFKTLANANSVFTRNLRYKSRGADVVALQDILRTRGYLSAQSTGYFGTLTLRAVKAFQKDMNISPTGIVAIKTRAALAGLTNPIEETFEGIIQSVSTACFADGECSVTIDGKKVVTTIGWSQEVVGSIKGSVQSIGDIQTQKIGARAKVYAKKTLTDYTLYGSSDYYIEVF